MEDYRSRLDEIIDAPYSGSENPPKTEDTKAEIRRIQSGVMEDDEFKRLRDSLRKNPLP